MVSTGPRTSFLPDPTAPFDRRRTRTNGLGCRRCRLCTTSSLDPRPSTSSSWARDPAGRPARTGSPSAGWSVCLIEKKHFPREKTCGDGLTPRSVHQLARWDSRPSVAAHGHRYQGLRAFGFGASLEMTLARAPDLSQLRLHDHALQPRRTRRRARRAAAAPRCSPASRPSACSSRRRRRHGGLRGAAGVVVKDKASGDDGRDPRPLPRRRRRPELAPRSRARHDAQPRLAHGHGAARLLHERSPRRAVDRLAPRHPRPRRATSCPATAGSSPSATVASTSASACSRRAAPGRA